MEKDQPQLLQKNQLSKQHPNQPTEEKQDLQNGVGEQLFQRIQLYLKQEGRPFETMQHLPTRTSEQSALIRNTPLEWGAKTMLIKGKEGIFLLVYRANRKISWSKLRKLECVGKKGAMCGEQEVLKLGVKPGGVPPFARFLGVKGIIDKKFEEQKMVAFNAGLQNKSIIIATADFPLADQLFFDITD